MPGEIKDKNGEPIKEGDHVFARARSGSHEGNVEKIVTTKEEAEKEGVKHPPKVCTYRLRSSNPGPFTWSHCVLIFHDHRSFTPTNMVTAFNITREHCNMGSSRKANDCIAV
jgi:hypothetical protein